MGNGGNTGNIHDASLSGNRKSPSEDIPNDTGDEHPLCRYSYGGIVVDPSVHYIRPVHLAPTAPLLPISEAKMNGFPWFTVLRSSRKDDMPLKLHFSVKPKMLIRQLAARHPELFKST